MNFGKAGSGLLGDLAMGFLSLLVDGLTCHVDERGGYLDEVIYLSWISKEASRPGLFRLWELAEFPIRC